MYIFSWEELLQGPAMVQKPTALSIGGFDGPHRGHHALFAAVADFAQEAQTQMGLITFVRSPAAQKKGGSYLGDVASLRQRLQKFQEFGFDFVVIVDFSASFAKMEGRVFFDIILKTICIKCLVVGSDFRCGYRLDTGILELQQLSSQWGFRFDSIGQVWHAESERISSTAIRRAISVADFTLAKNLLGYPFLLDIKGLSTYTTGGLKISKAKIIQILPPLGRYDAYFLSYAKNSSRYNKIRGMCVIHDDYLFLFPHTDEIQEDIPLFESIEFIKRSR